MARRKALPGEPAATRVVPYIRVSSLMGRGGESFHSPDVQLRGILRKVDGMLVLDQVDDDIDESGKNFERPGMQRIKELADEGLIDALAVYKIDRFGRNVLEALLCLKYLAERGIRIISAMEHVDTSTPDGKKHLVDLLNAAEYRSNEIGHNWSQVIEQRAGQGKHHGRAPVGYRREDGGLVIDPETGPAVIQAFKDYADDEPISKINRAFSLATGVGRAGSNLKKILRRPVYIGKIVLHDEILPGAHTPLIDIETWDKVQDRLVRDAGTPPRLLAVTWALAGLGACHNGHRLRRHRKADSKGGEKRDRLICSRSKWAFFGDPCEGIGSPRLDDIEASVLRQTREYIANLKVDVAAQATIAARGDTNQHRIAQLTKQLNENRAAMRRVVSSWGKGDMPRSVYRETMAEFMEEEKALEEALAKLRHSAKGKQITPLEAITAAEAMLELWPEMDVVDRAQSISAVVGKFVVSPPAYYRQPGGARTQVTEWV